MKIAAVQMVSTPSVERNLETARRLVGRAAADGATLVVLPEYFCFMGKADRDKLAIGRAGDDRPPDGIAFCERRSDLEPRGVASRRAARAERSDRCHTGGGQPDTHVRGGCDPPHGAVRTELVQRAQRWWRCSR